MDSKLKYIAYGLLIAQVGRSLVLGTTTSDVGAIITLAALSALLSYVEKHKKIQEVVEVVTKQNEVIHKLTLELDHVRTAVSGMKLGMNFQKIK